MQTPTRTTFSTEVPESSCFSLVLVGACRKDAFTKANLLVRVTSWIAHEPSNAQVGLHQASPGSLPVIFTWWAYPPSYTTSSQSTNMVGVMTYKPWNVQP